MAFHLSLQIANKAKCSRITLMFMFYIQFKMYGFLVFERFLGFGVTDFSLFLFFFFVDNFAIECIRSLETKKDDAIVLALSIQQSRSNFAYASKWLIMLVGITCSLSSIGNCCSISSCSANKNINKCLSHHWIMRDFVHSFFLQSNQMRHYKYEHRHFKITNGI